ncbi:MAG: hypothetical protein U0165_01905 [Polyangiaceae bacterium]
MTSWRWSSRELGAWRIVRISCAAIPLAMLGANGCTSDTRTPSPIARESFLDALANAYCEVGARCCAPEAFNANDACVDDFKALYSGADALIKLDEPSVSYDAGAAGRCIAAIQGLRGICYIRSTESSAVRSECASVFKGLPDAGERCTPLAGSFPLSQCADAGSVCDTTTRMCVKLPVAGEPCTQHCASDSYCDSLVCRPIRSANQPCPTPLACDSYTCSSFVCTGEAAESGIGIATLLPTACLRSP